MTQVLPLSRIGLADTDRVGRKAAVLGELLQRGYAVPDGFVVPVSYSGGLPALGGRRWAVRSSAVDEDLDGQSYAGQYETVLNVSGADAVDEAIRTCRASASSERAVAYGGSPTDMAVLVQEMVDASIAGVAFSRNPVTGDPDEALVSAVRGLGDKLVSGEVDAEEWSVRAATADGPGVLLTASQAVAVAALARRIAVEFGAPQDVEWAIDRDGTLWLLQARPITALPDAIRPVPVEIVVPDGVSTRNRSMDRPWTPFERSVFLPVFSAALPKMFAYTSGVAPTATVIGGWTYITVSAPPGPVATGDPVEIVTRWHDEWKHAYASTIAALRSVDLTSLADDELVAHTRAVVDLFTDLHDRYFELTGAAIAIGSRLGRLCGELLGWTPAQVSRLRGGLSGDHMGATTVLSDLARLGEADPRFSAAFDDYIARYAHRTVGFDLTEPTLAEQPAVLLALIRAQAAAPFDFVAERSALAARIAGALAEARTALADRPAAERERFETAVDAGVLSAPVRDEKVFYAVSTWALLRYAALELGGRLPLDHREDVFYLSLDEALAPGDADLRAVVRRRRGEHLWALANPGPESYGGAAAPPAPPPPPDDGAIRGLAASAGRYTGPVRVVRSVAEFGKLRHGDVLVCPETTAQWSILFPSVGALVTDRGSLLSHPAIIAREYGVPAVVATGNATSALRDDQIVVVDGLAGTVSVMAVIS